MTSDNQIEQMSQEHCGGPRSISCKFHVGLLDGCGDNFKIFRGRCLCQITDKLSLITGKNALTVNRSKRRRDIFTQ